MISRRKRILGGTFSASSVLFASATLAVDPLVRLLLIGAAVGCAGSGAGRCLAGNWPAVSLLDELRLRSTPLEVLAELYRRNRRISNLVVSFTTIPSRMAHIQLTLKSLLRQSVRPREIRLNLPSVSRREGVPYEIPDWLGRLEGVTLVSCEDHGPATKLIPSLDLEPESRVLVLDDDRVYGPRLVEEMEAQARSQPGRILGGSGWNAPADLVDRPTTLTGVLRGDPYVPVLGTNVTRPERIDILQGLQSYLVRPRFFDKERLLDYSGAPPEARWCDDVWVSAHALVEKCVIPLSRVSAPHRLGAGHLKATSLARNFNTKAEPEARSNTILLRHFRDRWGGAGS